MIEASDLHKTFTQGNRTVEVLRGVSLQIPEGESVAIVGESGSGKSTLLSLLAGLDRPTRGSLRVQGRNIEFLTDAELTRFRRNHVGIVFQQYHLVSDLTALENVALPLDFRNERDTEKSAAEALARVGLSERLNHLPSELSGGECQRVAIARALITRPTLLLADEPTGNLDFETGREVADVLFSVARDPGSTFVLVTHSLELAERCQRTLRLVEGRLE